MKIQVRAKPGAKKESIEERDGIFFVSVKVPAKEGRANFAIEKLLSEYFQKNITQIRLIKGKASKDKLFEIED